jgi:hypothetical protein
VLLALTRLAEVVPGLTQRAYYDLNSVGSRHWSSLRFVQERDPVSLQPTRDPDQYRYARINPQDNAQNLSAEMIAELEALPDRQRRRFFEGVYQTEVDGMPVRKPPSVLQPKRRRHLHPKTGGTRFWALPVHPSRQTSQGVPRHSAAAARGRSALSL